MEVKRGDIIRLKRLETHGSLQNSSPNRPYVVISNDVGNHFSNICIVAPLSLSNKKLSLPTHTVINYNNSMVICEQMFTISQDDILDVSYHLSDSDIRKIDLCIKEALALW